MFTELESHLQLNQTQTAYFLGLSQSAYRQYRNGSRKIPRYVTYQIELLLMTPESRLKKLKCHRLERG